MARRAKNCVALQTLSFLVVRDDHSGECILIDVCCEGVVAAILREEVVVPVTRFVDLRENMRQERWSDVLRVLYDADDVKAQGDRAGDPQP